MEAVTKLILVSRPIFRRNLGTLRTSGAFKSFSTTKSNFTEQDLNITISQGVKTITLNRPKYKNALNGVMYHGVAESLIQSNNDENVVVNVITGSGDFFCSGNDMTDFKNNAISWSHEQKLKWKDNFGNFVDALIDCQKPLIALVNGPAIGIGTTMLGLCDIVYAVDRAYFLTPFSSLGICPEACSSYTLPRIMGYGKAHEVITFGKKLSAEEAAESGLVTEVYNEADFQEKVVAKVASWAKLPLKSLVYSKELVRGRERQMLHEVNAKEGQMNFDLRQMPAHREAVENFFSRSKK